MGTLKICPKCNGTGEVTELELGKTYPLGSILLNKKVSCSLCEESGLVYEITTYSPYKPRSLKGETE